MGNPFIEVPHKNWQEKLQGKTIAGVLSDNIDHVLLYFTDGSRVRFEIDQFDNGMDYVCFIDVQFREGTYEN